MPLLYVDGKMLAVGNRDNYIYVYEVSEDGKKYHKVGRCSVSEHKIHIHIYLSTYLH